MIARAMLMITPLSTRESYRVAVGDGKFEPALTLNPERRSQRHRIFA